MPTRIALLLLLFLATACASANPRPEATQPPPPAPQPPIQAPRPIQRTSMPTPAPSRRVSSDPGVRTLNPPVVGGLVAETEPERQGVSNTPAPPARQPAPAPTGTDDELGAPPTGPLPPIPGSR